MSTPDALESAAVPDEADVHAVDVGTIAWLLPEIVAAFDSATTALRAFRAGAAGVDRRDVDLAPLRVARSHLHQAHGALQLGEIAGVTKLTEAMEELLARFEGEPGRCDATTLDAIVGGCRAIVEYLEDLRGGGRQQPLYLFPSYRDLLVARGVDRIQPADLFVVNLDVRVPKNTDGAAPDNAALREQRSTFEQALLRYLRNGEDASALSALHRAVVAIDASVAGDPKPGQGRRRGFWWVVRALFDALANGGFARVPAQQPHLKRLAGRINLQIRQLVDGSAVVADRLYADTLFFVALAEPVTSHVREVQQRFGLADAVPADFEVQRYGRVDSGALRAARESLAAAKVAWSGIVAGEVAQIRHFTKATGALVAAVGPIRRRGLAQVAQVIDGIATDLDFDPRQPTPAIGLDVATALLFLEGALERARWLDDAFDARAALVVDRVEAAVLGRDQAPGPVDWLDRMAREAEERLTLATFVAEMQASLRHAEKVLDAFFRDPIAERRGLAEAQKALAQASGALALLGHEDVHRAIEHARGTIGRFQDDATLVDATAFAELAQSLGAVGFYVDQIARERIDAGVFHYDVGSGRFSADMARGPAVAADREPASMPDDAVPVARSAEPPVVLDAFDDIAAVEESQAAVAPVPVPEFDPFAATDIYFAATQILEPDAPSEDELAFRAADARDRVAGSLEHRDDPAPLPSGPASPPLPADDRVDAELLDIFLEEAGEVLADANAAMRVLDADPQSATAVVNLRRGFHTLKGSGRMVGLAAFGAAAWSIEDTLNGHIADQGAASADLRALVSYAVRYLTDWVDELRASGQSSRIPDALIEAARAVRRSDDAIAATQVLGEDPAVPAESGIAVGDTEPAPTMPEVDSTPPFLELDFGVDEDAPMTGQQPPAAAITALDDSRSAATDNVVPFRSPETARQDDTRQIGSLTLSVALFNIYLSEADELLRVLTQDFAEWRHELDRPVSEGAMRAAHSLAGSSATVGLVPAHDLAAAIEDVLQTLWRDPVVLRGDQVGLLQDAVESLRKMLHRFAAERLPEPDAVRLAGLLSLRREIVGDGRAAEAPSAIAAAPASPEREVAPLPFEPLDFGDAPVVREVGASVDEPALPQDDDGAAAAPFAFEDAAPELADRADATSIPDGVMVVDGAAVDAADADRLFADLTPVDPSFDEAMAAPSIDGASAPDAGGDDAFDDVDAMGPVDVALTASDAAPASGIGAMPFDDEAADVEDDTADAVAATGDGPLFDDEPIASESPPETPAMAADIHSPSQAAGIEPEHRPGAIEVPSALRDDIDPELLEIFVAEGGEILPQIGTLLRTWQAQPADAAPARLLLRHLHTLKGSARMAGAMRLGEVAHEIEARVETAARLHDVPPALLDELLAAHDRSLELFDRLQRPAPAVGVTEAPVEPTVAAAPDDAATRPAEVAADAAPRPREQKQVSQAAVRVNSETLDRLVNLAGEVSISRARIENEVLQIKGAMADLGDNVERLRSQLREIELQAEFQMQSQMQSQQSAGQEREKFDPLEFDRFTRFQELTRMMAESVNDVKTLQQHLQKSLDAAETDLAAQRRMTRDLQQDLMRVRMVPFSSIAERLYRVARQTAKEIDKRVNLDIRGGSVEIDRSVLERMAGPFEHLLRNHIVHGIETRDARRAAGKNETGELLVEVRQEGNEIVLTFSDDGAGLDHDRIRAKGRELGLVDRDLSDAEAAELIFHPGFSTAAEVTELAGRGVGMDVVRAEALVLAGRIAVDSDPGRGTRFAINLPLTLAITQVVLVQVAGRAYALPAVLVEQVQQLRPQPLADAYRAGHLEWAGAPVRVAFLGTLLGIDGAIPVAQRSSPVLILRSAGERIAIHVDEILGNQEVVVKNLGPQLARMTGIAGATVPGFRADRADPEPGPARPPDARRTAAAAGGAGPAVRPGGGRTGRRCRDRPPDVADRDGRRRLADRASRDPAAAVARGLPGGAREGRRRRARAAPGLPARRDAGRHRDAADGRFRLDPQRPQRRTLPPHPDHHDHVADGREAPPPRGIARGRRVPRQAVPGGRAARPAGDAREGEARASRLRRHRAWVAGTGFVTFDQRSMAKSSKRSA